MVMGNNKDEKPKKWFENIDEFQKLLFCSPSPFSGKSPPKKLEEKNLFFT